MPMLPEYFTAISNPQTFFWKIRARRCCADSDSDVSISQSPFSDSLGTGTLAFTAPVVLIRQEVSPCSHLYSIGMVLHSMLRVNSQ